MYADAVGPDQTGTAPAAHPVVEDLAAKAPEVDPTPTSRSVPENYATGDMYGRDGTPFEYPNVGAPVIATDPNDDTMTYRLGGADMGSFNIDQASGQIPVKTATELDLESKATYMVTVTATDPGGLSDSVDVTIKLTDDDEAPVIMLGGLTISGTRMAYYEENRMDAVETYMASGPMASRARWSLAGDDAGDFRISHDGVLTFRSSPDYENPTDMGTDNTYKVTVKANDGTYMDTQDVIVMVTDVEELGMLSGNSSPSYMENSEDVVATYMPSGPDMATWSLEGTDKGYFTITAVCSSSGTLPTTRCRGNRAMSGHQHQRVHGHRQGQGRRRMDEIMVTVTVANVAEIGTLSWDSSRSYMENSDDAVATYTADGSMADMATLSGGHRLHHHRRDTQFQGGDRHGRPATWFMASAAAKSPRTVITNSKLERCPDRRARTTWRTAWTPWEPTRSDVGHGHFDADGR